MTGVLYAGRSAQWETYRGLLAEPLSALRPDLSLINMSDGQVSAPEDVEYILYAPDGPLVDFAPFINTKLVQSLWAGVERVVGNPSLNQPLARMVEDGLRLGMADYVMGHVMRHHLDSDYFAQAAAGTWDPHRVPPLARDRRVGILGLGALGGFVGQKLAQYGFNVAGWSRSAKNLTGITSYHGDAGLDQLIRQSEIVVLLLPRTAATENIIDAARLAQMPRGAAIINPGRGQLINDADLLAALNSGHISGATLDVFRTEPLPAQHPYWAHPNVLVTSHIASVTRPEHAAEVILDNIARSLEGREILNLVDRDAGY
ncbi:glyoxylate/hydroxypyruvate reductase A [Amylibacter marinus]|uniref:Glyoxylate/hydroxypyruvate reductase A n=1 Tax=Amylibacter marinus TaxID=1475483 RepID=A0ABQ5VYU3_9RHOB|nr:glyoxylate/hydroxypyruvate reductase A [Amylibacter marinus]GLQ36253.1 glyoxylate/hydroxypyruvate reductase A [Amylibacter marinus]